MPSYQVNKTFQEINEKIKKGQAVVVTAEEIIDIVRQKGEVAAARQVDVVTTGTFSAMCSSGAFLNLGHSKPPIKANKVWLNGVPAYGGVAAVDVYLGATETTMDDRRRRLRRQRAGRAVPWSSGTSSAAAISPASTATRSRPISTFRAN